MSAQLSLVVSQSLDVQLAQSHGKDERSWVLTHHFQAQITGLNNRPCLLSVNILPKEIVSSVVHQCRELKSSLWLWDLQCKQWLSVSEAVLDLWCSLLLVLVLGLQDAETGVSLKQKTDCETWSLTVNDGHAENPCHLGENQYFNRLMHRHGCSISQDSTEWRNWIVKETHSSELDGGSVAWWSWSTQGSCDLW